MLKLLSFCIFNNSSALLTARCASRFCAPFSSAHLCHPPEAFILVGDCTPTETSLLLHSPLIEVGVFFNWDKSVSTFMKWGSLVTWTYKLYLEIHSRLLYAFQKMFHWLLWLTLIPYIRKKQIAVHCFFKYLPKRKLTPIFPGRLICFPHPVVFFYIHRKVPEAFA